tara:strand:+ start:28187 stop:28924 length:738 start_codon:yes stop_codon:yes gene_type:complete
MSKLSVNKIIKETLGYIYYNSYKRYKRQFGNRSLIYHAFGSKLSHDTYGISININDFKNHLIFLKNNYDFCHITDVNNSNKLKISITIDDGYKDTLLAAEYLNLYKIPFTLFITTDFIGKKHYLSKNNIQELCKLDNCIIGSHGKTHAKFGMISKDNMYKELHDSKLVLEDICGVQIYGLAYPHGSYNHETIKIAKKLDYLWAASSIKGINNKYSNKYLLNRSEVIRTDKIKDLTKKINGFYDYY